MCWENRVYWTTRRKFNIINLMAVKKSNCGQPAGKIVNRSKIIPEEIGYYLSGFADGEASFNVSIINANS